MTFFFAENVSYIKHAESTREVQMIYTCLLYSSPRLSEG